MASTFRRPAATKVARQRNNDDKKPSPSETPALRSDVGLKGTKPWPGGTTRTSTGLGDLDFILSGGQALGTCICLTEDRWTNSLAYCLIQYWCAQAVSHEQVLLIPFDEEDEESDKQSGISSWYDIIEEDFEQDGVHRSELEDLLKSLPRNLHLAKVEDALAGKDNDVHTSDTKTLETLVEEERSGEDGDQDEGLKNAWQYRTTVQRERTGRTATDAFAASKGTSSSSSSLEKVYCHSFDLDSGSLCHQLNVLGATTTRIIKVPSHSRLNGFAYYTALVAQLRAEQNANPGRVIRLLLYHPDPATLCTALPLLLTFIRSGSLPVVILVSVRPWKAKRRSSNNLVRNPASALLLLERASDVVLEAEGFASRLAFPPPVEFQNLHGLLSIRKVSTTGSSFADWTANKRPAANLYGLKRDRRKLHIQLLHIPPEDYATAGGSVSSGGVRSGAGQKPEHKDQKGCGGTGGNSSSLVDF